MLWLEVPSLWWCTVDLVGNRLRKITTYVVIQVPLLLALAHPMIVINPISPFFRNLRAENPWLVTPPEVILGIAFLISMWLFLSNPKWDRLVVFMFGFLAAGAVDFFRHLSSSFSRASLRQRRSESSLAAEAVAFRRVPNLTTMSTVRTVSARSGGVIGTFALDLDASRWTSNVEFEEGDFPFGTEVDGKRYEIYSDGTIANVETDTLALSRKGLPPL